jgi:hypothetical protein
MKAPYSSNLAHAAVGPSRDPQSPGAGQVVHGGYSAKAKAEQRAYRALLEECRAQLSVLAELGLVKVKRTVSRMTPKNRKPTYHSISQLLGDLHGPLHVCSLLPMNWRCLNVSFFRVDGEVMLFPALQIQRSLLPGPTVS